MVSTCRSGKARCHFFFCCDRCRSLWWRSSVSGFPNFTQHVTHTLKATPSKKWMGVWYFRKTNFATLLIFLWQNRGPSWLAVDRKQIKKNCVLSYIHSRRLVLSGRTWWVCSSPRGESNQIYTPTVTIIVALAAYFLLHDVRVHISVLYRCLSFRS